MWAQEQGRSFGLKLKRHSVWTSTATQKDSTCFKQPLATRFWHPRWRPGVGVVWPLNALGSELIFVVLRTLEAGIEGMDSTRGSKYRVHHATDIGMRLGGSTNPIIYIYIIKWSSQGPHLVLVFLLLDCPHCAPLCSAMSIIFSQLPTFHESSTRRLQYRCF